MQAKVYDLSGNETGTVELDDAIFGLKPNMAVIRQAVLRQQANARQGTHDTKTRADVSGGGRKPWRQKGTGRARQGSTRSPQWRHGGVVFGPHPRSYEQDMPRKMRRLAIRGVLSAKAADGQLVLVESFRELEPRTKAMIEALKKLNVADKSALIMTASYEANLQMASANLPRVKTLKAHMLSVVDMLKYDYLIMPRASLEVVHSILGNTGGRRKLPLKGFGSAPQHGNGTPIAAPVSALAAENIAFEPTAEVAELAQATTTTTITTEPAKATSTKKSGKKQSTAPQTAAEETAAQETAPESKTTRRKRPTAAPMLATDVVIANVQYRGDEYIEIKNNGSATTSLAGWTLRDQNNTDQQYVFPDSAQLAVGESLQVYTKPGHDYTFNSKRPIWNDKGAAMELLNANGDVVSAYAYGTYEKGKA